MLFFYSAQRREQAPSADGEGLFVLSEILPFTRDDGGVFASSVCSFVAATFPSRRKLLKFA